jgi:hypothetical protein
MELTWKETAGSRRLTDDLLVPEVGFGPFVAMAVTRPLLMVVFGDSSDAIATPSQRTSMSDPFLLSALVPTNGSGPGDVQGSLPRRKW